jgi:serine phosphatase RsbU (regulator of sigma subunit)
MPQTLDRFHLHDALWVEATRLQRSLLPPDALEQDWFEVAWSYQPAHQVGGDLLEALVLPGEARLLLLVADVMGHGPASAMVASALHAIAHARLQDGVTAPGRLLACLNAITGTLFDGYFATAAACVIDGATGHLTFSLAGHPPILVAHEATGVRQLSVPGQPLGLTPPDEPYEESRITLAEGSAILLYTDGVTETPGQNGTARFGIPEAVLNATRDRSASEIVRALRDAVCRFRGAGPRNEHDDCTILAARYLAAQS